MMKEMLRMKKEDGDGDEDEDEDDEVRRKSEEIAKMMGFSNFTSTKKT